VGEIDRAACRRSAEERFTVRRMVDDVEAMYRSVLSRTDFPAPAPIAEPAAPVA